MFGLKRSIMQIEVSAAAYDEIALAMVAAGAHVTVTEAGLEMRGVGLMRGPDPEPVAQRHRPINGPVKKNTAPGAI